jgi:holliday junction DNA helicase RuvA
MYSVFFMISHLRGTLLEKHPNQVIVDVHGVGYEVTIPVSAYSSLPDKGAPVQLHVHTHVREDALALFGFLSASDKALFEKLITVSGIGPKLAITALSGLTTAELVAAIRSGSVEQLVRVPGIGKKTAERLLLELKGKLGDAVGGVAVNRPKPVASDVMNALLSLGYNDKEAQLAVKHLPEGLSVSEGIRQALRSLSKS